MKANWEEFELQCTDYLNTTFGPYASFIHQGGADSTTPDILVESHNGASFYIEAKHSPAQCGQFVLLPNIETKKFEYSSQNANRINEYASRIISFMNERFDEFREAGTAGKEIDMPNGEEVFSEWVVDIYGSKGVRFFITNDYTLFPIERFRDFFEISAKYRIKRSGSSPVGKNHTDIVLDYIMSHNYDVNGARIDGPKLLVKSQKNLHNLRFVLRANEYMFSIRNEEYEIRKLSNTYNANVIFSVIQQRGTSGISDENFISFLRQ